MSKYVITVNNVYSDELYAYIVDAENSEEAWIKFAESKLPLCVEVGLDSSDIIEAFENKDINITFPVLVTAIE